MLARTSCILGQAENTVSCAGGKEQSAACLVRDSHKTRLQMNAHSCMPRICASSALMCGMRNNPEGAICFTIQYLAQPLAQQADDDGCYLGWPS